MSATLNIGLSGWIIQDGNYAEFEAGREYRFALEFGSDDLALDADPGSGPRLSHVRASHHEVRGVVVFRSESAWVVDFGVPAYQLATPPAWASVGLPVRGRVDLGVDPYFYSAELRHREGMPDLFRRWFVRRILLETTPWKDVTDPLGLTVSERDASRESFVEVPATDAWHHEGGNAEYFLECEIREGPPLHPGGGG
jgi:hypothetical protein